MEATREDMRRRASPAARHAVAGALCSLGLNQRAQNIEYESAIFIMSSATLECQYGSCLWCSLTAYRVYI